MTHAQALIALHLDKGATDDEINAAFKGAAQAVLSYRKGDMIEPFYGVIELRKAREILLNLQEPAFKPCRICKGRGILPLGLGQQPCIGCNGTGERTT